jgi:methylmalonyl-CoA mutase N-terminal domain/subunit
VVGVNCHRLGDEPEAEVLALDPRAEDEQIDRLESFRAARDRRRVEASLSALERAAREDRNLLPPILDAVRAEATLGEVADTLRAVFGEHHEAALAGD